MAAQGERRYNVALTATDGFSGQFNKLVAQITGTESAAGKLAMAMRGIGGALALREIANVVSNITNAAAALDDLSEKTGASVESLSRFAGVARITGQDLGTVESSMGRLSKALVEAQDGGSDAAAAFKAFGISIRDGSGNLRNAGDVMDELARTQGDFQDGAGKAAAMMQLLGRSGAEIIPFLNDYVRLGDQVNVTTADQAKAAEDFNIQVGLLQEKLNALLRETILPLLPQMTALVQSFDDLAAAITKAAPSGKGPLESFLESIHETNVQTIGEIAYIQQAWENFKLWWKGEGDKRVAPAQASANAIRQAEMDALARAARALPPLMEAGATAADKVAVAFRKTGDSAKYVNGHLDEMQRLTKQLDEELAASKKFWNELEKEMEKTAEAAGRYATAQAEAMERDASEREANIRSVYEQVNAIELEVEQLGMSNEEREQSTLLLALENSGLDVNSEAYLTLAERIKAATQAKKDFASNQDAMRANEDAAKAAADEWKKTADSISDSLTDALLRGFESGKDFAKNMRDTLVNMFKTLVLRPIIQGVLAPVAGGLSGMFPGAANASSGAGSILGGMSGGGDIFSGIGSLLTGGGGALAAGLSTFAGNTALAFGASASTSLALAGVASMIGTAIPVIGIALAIASALGAFERGGPKQGGSASSTADLGLDTVSPGGLGRLFTPDQKDAAMQTIADQVANDYMAVARSLGLSAGSASFGFGFDTDPEGEAGTRISAQASVGGQNVFNVADLSVDDADMNAALETQASRAMLAALKASDLPAYLANLLDGLDAATATPDQINAALQTAAALKIAVDAMAGLGDQFAAMDPTTVQEFVESFGGLEGFMERFAYIADAFYTDTQKLEKNTAALAEGFADLGLAVPDTHAAFLELLNGFDLTTEGGREMYEAISALAPLFVAVEGTAQQAADALANVGDTLEEVAEAASNIVDLGSLRETVYGQVQDVLSRVGDLVSQSGGDFGDQLALQIRLVGSEIERFRAMLGTVAGGSAEYQALEEIIARLSVANAGAAAELARFVVLSAQYDAERAGALVELERWYRDQQVLFRGNADALAALAEIFGDRWKEIVDGVAGGVDNTLEELKRLRLSLKDYLAGLKLRDDVSPLSPAAKLAEAQRQFQSLLAKAQGGDVDALREIQGAADAYLRIARDMFASSGDFTRIWQDVVRSLTGLAEPPTSGTTPTASMAAVASAMPKGSPVASSADIAAMKDEVTAMLRAVAAEARKASSAPVVRAVETATAAAATRK